VTVSQIINPVTVGNAVTIANAVTVAEVTAPVTVGGITEAVTVSQIVNPVTVGNAVTIANAVTVAEVTAPVTVGGITEAVTVSQIINPVTVGNAVTIANAVTVAEVTTPVTVGGITEAVTVSQILNPVTISNAVSIAQAVTVSEITAPVTVIVDGYNTVYAEDSITGNGVGNSATQTVNTLTEYSYYVKNNSTTDVVEIALQTAPTNVDAAYVLDAEVGTQTLAIGAAMVIVPSKYANNSRIRYNGSNLDTDVYFVGRS
ncbi:MAG: DUF6385 domain-containing protein, partial [Clostridium sp.]